jgi:HEAT repeat protein
MARSSARRLLQTKPHLSVGTLVALSVFGLAPAGYGQADRVSQLIGKLKDRNSGVRAKAAFSLGLNRDPRAVEPLIAALGDKAERVRSPATWSLGKIGDRRAVEPLIAALRDTDGGVRRGWRRFQGPWAREQEVRALGKIKDPRAVDPLIAALKDMDPTLRDNAAWSLGEIKDSRAVEPLSAALNDANPDVRRRAAEALGKVRSRAAATSCRGGEFWRFAQDPLGLGALGRTRFPTRGASANEEGFWSQFRRRERPPQRCDGAALAG